MKDTVVNVFNGPGGTRSPLFLRYCPHCQTKTWWNRPIGRKSKKAPPSHCANCGKTNLGKLVGNLDARIEKAKPKPLPQIYVEMRVEK